MHLPEFDFEMVTVLIRTRTMLNIEVELLGKNKQSMFCNVPYSRNFLAPGSVSWRISFWGLDMKVVAGGIVWWLIWLNTSDAIYDSFGENVFLYSFGGLVVHDLSGELSQQFVTMCLSIILHSPGNHAVVPFPFLPFEVSSVPIINNFQ